MNKSLLAQSKDSLRPKWKLDEVGAIIRSSNDNGLHNGFVVPTLSTPASDLRKAEPLRPDPRLPMGHERRPLVRRAPAEMRAVGNV